MPEGETPKPRSRSVREEDPEQRRWLAITILSFAILGLYALHGLAYVLPAHWKTLARDAVISGALGAALLVQEFVRDVVGQIRFLPVAVAGGVIGLVGVAVLEGLHIYWWIGAVAVVAAGVVAYIVAALVDPATLNRLGHSVGPSVVRYGPFVLGLALLLLSMFLQLRSIELDSG